MKEVTDKDVQELIKNTLEQGLNIKEEIIKGRKQRKKMNKILIGASLLMLLLSLIAVIQVYDNKNVCTLWYQNSPFYFEASETFDFVNDGKQLFNESSFVSQWSSNKSFRDQYNNTNRLKELPTKQDTIIEEIS